MTIPTEADKQEACDRPDDAAELLRGMFEIIEPGQTTPAWLTIAANFSQLLTINTPESLLAAAMMLVDDAEKSELLSGACRTVAKDLALHMRFAKPEDNYTLRLALALAAAIAQSKEKP